MSAREIEAMKRSIEVQLDEYEQALIDADAWYQAWKAKQPKGFKATRRAT